MTTNSDQNDGHRKQGELYMGDKPSKDIDFTAQSIFEEFGRQEAAILTGAVLALGLAGPGQAAEPAVAAPNAKLQLSGGKSGGNSVSALSGSASLPLGDRFGAQLDGLAGSVDGNSTKGGALHLFTRNPDSYLAGITGARIEYRGLDVNLTGIAGELYRDKWTLGIGGGRQTGDLGNADYYRASVSYYAKPDLVVKASADGYDSTSGYSLGGEWQFTPGWSLTLGAGDGDGDSYVFAGVQFYMGNKASLVAHHRKDDPENTMLQAVTALKQSLDGKLAPPLGVVTR